MRGAVPQVTDLMGPNPHRHELPTTFVTLVIESHHEFS